MREKSYLIIHCMAGLCSPVHSISASQQYAGNQGQVKYGQKTKQNQMREFLQRNARNLTCQSFNLRSYCDEKRQIYTCFEQILRVWTTLINDHIKFESFYDFCIQLSMAAILNWTHSSCRSYLWKTNTIHDFKYFLKDAKHALFFCDVLSFRGRFFWKSVFPPTVFYVQRIMEISKPEPIRLVHPVRSENISLQFISLLLISIHQSYLSIMLSLHYFSSCTVPPTWVHPKHL